MVHAVVVAEAAWRHTARRAGPVAAEIHEVHFGRLARGGGEDEKAACILTGLRDVELLVLLTQQRCILQAPKVVTEDVLPHLVLPELAVQAHVEEVLAREAPVRGTISALKLDARHLAPRRVYAPSPRKSVA
eukprot:CAMPEP_0180776034 /NCGR_PEP_ID=MMETSP1038_2-20121128/44589_1 /TAXON_ID=632150 /ORGANISM="Azadinium spinosum, Strain 3D9" /LENGTH=131 /DNA_ID=CAMNT_0022811137 /DNA_START=250 /DNA_END=645 /DNA_ORIENTATION=+